ncbi:energy-coupling factor ABC transporter permease [Rhodococcus sp. F64268]|uniref:energy-coupling factor ABC transporter permease n=1 Tax=Rhodococcus sp. F64268 TaxID=2926402 RepID=UPI001FF36A30|nr:energy-coupling factor ABC transporter permease [Rhodococcus sp. F64268]MCK0090680.1 energy-coupling factor ABC transporter permease [Rhodococcus sp. F64268]
MIVENLTVETVAMHMSDGLITPRASALFYVVAVLGLALAAWRARAELSEKSAATAALVTALVFAMQMIDVPVLPGVSGHVLGGAVAVLLIGPFGAALCLAFVLAIQAFVFADGGLTVLGANTTVMALAGVAGGYGTAVALRTFLTHRDTLSPTARTFTIAFTAGCASVFAAVTGFVVVYAISGASPMTLSTLAYLYGAHAPVALLEGLVTGAVLVASAGATHTRLVTALGAAAFGIACILSTFALSAFAANTPDALEAATLRGCDATPSNATPSATTPDDTLHPSRTGDCMARSVHEHRLAGSPLADYTVGGQQGSTGAAGAIGVLITLAVAGAGFRGLTRRRESAARLELPR